MSDDIAREQAMVLFERAYRHQTKGELADAIMLYKRSLAIHPTAKACTFLGWTYSMMNRYEEAIEWCQKAIDINPAYGNPYNDIGAYLIEQGNWEEALPWLEKALVAPEYANPEFAHTNMGRVHEHFGQNRAALESFDRALAINPYHRAAVWAKYALLGRLN